MSSHIHNGTRRKQGRALIGRKLIYRAETFPLAAVSYRNTHENNLSLGDTFIFARFYILYILHVYA